MNEFLKELAELLEKHDASLMAAGQDELSILVGDTDCMVFYEPLFGAEEAYGYSITA